MQVLLGVDAFWRNAEHDTRKCSTGISYAVKKVSDSSITGLLNQKSIIPESNSHFSIFIDLTKLEDATLTAIVEKNPGRWKDQALRKKTKLHSLIRVKKQLKFMEQSIEHDGYGYKTNLLRKSDAQKMPNNYPVSKTQLQSLQRRLKKDPENIQLFRKCPTSDLEKKLRQICFFFNTNIETFASIGLTKMLSSDTKKRDLSLEQNITHPMPFFSFI